MVKRAFFLVLVLALATVVRCGGDSGGDDTTDPSPDVTDDSTPTDTDVAAEPDGTVKPDGDTDPDTTPDTVCTPACEDKVCGDNGCGGVCGNCAADETCKADQSACEKCEPACDGKVCGDDGCGGNCGVCPDGVCNADGTACETVEFGKGSHFNALYIPASPEETGDDTAAAMYPDLAGAACVDVDGNGSIDNGLAAVLGIIKGFMADFDVNALIKENLFDKDEYHILLDLGENPTAAPFTLKGYLGQKDANPGEYLVKPESFQDGKAIIEFEGAKIENNGIALGPLDFPLGGIVGSFLPADMGIPSSAFEDLKLSEVQLVAAVKDVVDDAGAAFKGGTLGGAIFKVDLDNLIYGLNVWCADPNVPDETKGKICDYLSFADWAMLEGFGLTWDLDLRGCGKFMNIYDSVDKTIIVGQEDEENCLALSACIFWSSDKAKINGLAPVEPVE